MKLLRIVATIGVIIGGCLLITQGKTEAGVALLVLGIEEAYRNGTRAETESQES